jgi:pyridoxine kinase
MKPAIIVVNSHVVRGSVGGRAAVFALEHMGFPVWSLPTVSLAWHPGHGRSTRTLPEPRAFAATADELAASPRLGEVKAILVGYIGDISQVAPIARLVRAVKDDPGARFLYDPNIGDGDSLFQPADLAAEARDALLPLADIATPNRFELGWLSGRPLQSEGDVRAVAAALGPAEVVVTSARDDDGIIATMLATEGHIGVGEQSAAAGAPKGTGDLFAALYLGYRLEGATALEAMRRAASTVGRLCRRAAEMGADELPLAAGASDLSGNADDVVVSWSG